MLRVSLILPMESICLLSSWTNGIVVVESNGANRGWAMRFGHASRACKSVCRHPLVLVIRAVRG